MPSPDRVLDLSGGAVSVGPKQLFNNAKVWTRKDLSPSDWLVHLDSSMLAELDAVVRELRRQSVPLFMLDPAMFELSSVRKATTQVRRCALEGRGFAILDRLPLDQWSADEAKAVQWLILSTISHPVAQSAGGEIFRDVKNTPGRQRGFYGKGLTQDQLTFHTDNSGNRNVPNFSTLMAVHSAEEGGLSEYCTLYSLVNAMMKEAPDQLERLFQPYYHSRQGIQIPGEPDVIWAPAIGYDGERLLSRISLNKIPDGYKQAGEELDNLGRDALETAVAIIRKNDLSAQYMLQRGQILVFNNREGLHHRGPFKDGATVDKQRHLIRVWLRDEGRPFFDG